MISRVFLHDSGERAGVSPYAACGALCQCPVPNGRCKSASSARVSNDGPRRLKSISIKRIQIGQSLYRSIGKRTDAIFYLASPFPNEMPESSSPHLLFIELGRFFGGISIRHPVLSTQYSAVNSRKSWLLSFLCGLKANPGVQMARAVAPVILHSLSYHRMARIMSWTLRSPNHMGTWDPSSQGKTARFPWNVGSSLPF